MARYSREGTHNETLAVVTRREFFELRMFRSTYPYPFACFRSLKARLFSSVSSICSVSGGLYY